MSRCGTCNHFEGQTFPKKPGWKHAAGRCGWPMPALTLPDSITRSMTGKGLAVVDRNRQAVWPDDGATCPCWEQAI